MRLCVIFVALLIVAVTTATNECYNFRPNDTEIGNQYLVYFNFGVEDDLTNSVQTSYLVPLGSRWSSCCSNSITTDLWTFTNYETNYLYNSFSPIYINGIPVIGGHNGTNFSDEYVPTASNVCSNNNQTIMWGPGYPDFRNSDVNLRGQYPNLEVYIQWSVPSTTSYMREIVFVTNKGNKDERLYLHQTNYVQDRNPVDISPPNEGRYMAGYPWLENDAGDPKPEDRKNYNKTLTATHARSPNSRTKLSAIYVDNDHPDGVGGVIYHSQIKPGETQAIMIVYGFSRNTTQMLARAAWVDNEPAEIFHGLNADQLSQIVNWGACQAVLGPDVTVTVNPPASCSNSATTSDFTVSVTTTRDDFTSGFTHRVVLAAADLAVVPAQSATTLSVTNGVGAVKHQLWYNGCLVKETAFTACAEAASSPAQSVSAASTAKSSVVVLLSLVAVFAMF